MGFSIHVDWSGNLEGKWDNIGRSLIEQNCKHKGGMQYSGFCEKCEQYEDSCHPMMNYAYPLETTPEDNKVIEVCQKTSCTVMYNSEEDKYYLALTGGGMDLSQNIALAYNILERWVPLDLALEVSTQDGLNFSGKTFRRVMRACKESIKKDIDHGTVRIKKIKEAVKKSLEKSRGA